MENSESGNSWTTASGSRPASWQAGVWDQDITEYANELND